MVGDFANPKTCERCRIVANRLHLARHSRPGGRQHPAAALFEETAEAIPTARRHPQAVDENDGLVFAIHGSKPSVVYLSVNSPTRLTLGNPFGLRANADVAELFVA